MGTVWAIRRESLLSANTADNDGRGGTGIAATLRLEFRGALGVFRGAV